MALRKSPTRTPAFLAANRANARKSTGPRTPQGKAQAALNALRHGRRASDLPERLLRAGQNSGEAEYRWFRSQIAAAFCPGSGPGSEREQREAGRLAAMAWTRARRMPTPRTKPESPLPSRQNDPWHPWLSPIQIVHRPNRVGLVFWIQHCKYWTFRRVLQAFLDGAPFGHSHPPSTGWEAQWRRRVYRTKLPSLWERIELEKRIKRHLGGRATGG
jgi:hypothetical protein